MFWLHCAWWGVGVIHRDHQMFCFSSNLGSATWLVNTVCFLCPVLSQSTFLVNGHLYFTLVKVHWMSWGFLNIKPANLTLCYVSSLPQLLLIFKPLCNPAPLQLLLSCCIPRPTVHWKDFSVTSSRQTGICECEASAAVNHSFTFTRSLCLEYLDLPLSLTSGLFLKCQYCRQWPTQSKPFTKVS